MYTPRISTLPALALLAASLQVSAQTGIESVEVETYYISDASDATDTDGANPDPLAEGSVTYRVFLDLAPGWRVNALFGDTNHVLHISTTTLLWNNGDRGEAYGWRIPNNRLGDNTVALDSWLSFAAASDAHWGVPKDLDADGSIVGGANNDGGSAGVPGGLLVNNDPGAGLPLTDQDGLVPATAPEPTGWISVGDSPLDVFGDGTLDSTFTTSNFLLQAPQGVVGPGSDNRILIAQITTTGDLSFMLNVELENADGDVFRYVAGGDTLLPGEIQYGQLNYPPECGCTDPAYLEYDPGAGCPDPDACQTLIVFGCLDPNACNFDTVNANFNIPELCCYGPDSCNGLDITIVCPFLGVEDGTLNGSDLRTWPNPFSDRLTLRVSGSTGAPIDWALHDLMGRTVRRGVLGPANGDGLHELDLPGLPAGAYLLRIDAAGRRGTQVVVRQ